MSDFPIPGDGELAGLPLYWPDDEPDDLDDPGEPAAPPTPPEEPQPYTLPDFPELAGLPLPPDFPSPDFPSPDFPSPDFPSPEDAAPDAPDGPDDLGLDPEELPDINDPDFARRLFRPDPELPLPDELDALVPPEPPELAGVPVRARGRFLPWLDDDGDDAPDAPLPFDDDFELLSIYDRDVLAGFLDRGPDAGPGEPGPLPEADPLFPAPERPVDLRPDASHPERPTDPPTWSEPLYPLLQLARLRMGIDGAGVTTLVAGAGCPLRCRWCINAQLLRDGERELVTAEELVDRLRIDDLYFRATGGGVCFGGGEPLLHIDFLERFRQLAPAEWKITLETSLAVPEDAVLRAAELADFFIVDCKSMDREIYRRYTGGDGARMEANLRRLLALAGQERIRVRVPRIPDFNDAADQARSAAKLRELGVRDLDLFDYVRQAPPGAP